jgi:hypothetical protein
LLVSPEWVEEPKVRCGMNSPIYQSKVLGEFPDISDDSLIPSEVDRGSTETNPRAIAGPSCPARFDRADAHLSEPEPPKCTDLKVSRRAISSAAFA